MNRNSDNLEMIKTITQSKSKLWHYMQRTFELTLQGTFFISEKLVHIAQKLAAHLQYYWNVAILLKWSMLWGGGIYPSRLSDNWPVLLRAVEMRRDAPPLSIIIFCSWFRSNNDDLPYYLSHALASPLAAHVQLLAEIIGFRKRRRRNSTSPGLALHRMSERTSSAYTQFMR